MRSYISHHRWFLGWGANIIACLPFFNSHGLAHENEGVKTSIAVDMVAAFKASKASTAKDRLDLREAEVLFEAPIDHLFDGRLSIAAHQDDGTALFEIHEAYIQSTRLIPRSRLRVGQFFLGLGRLNSLHRHEWPMVFAPKVHEQFFGEEGGFDSGVEYSYLTPLPFFLEVSAGVTNGWTFGHSHSEGEKPRQPTHYGRVVTYMGLPSDGGAQIGINYLSRKAAAGEKINLFGGDVVAKWRQAGVLKVMMQGEAWHRSIEPEEGREEKTAGAYFFPALALSPTVQLGCVFDYYTILTLEDATGTKVTNYETGIVPTLTYKASEFSTFRIAYDWSLTKRDDEPDVIEQSILTQITFMMGAHPAHDF